KNREGPYLMENNIPSNANFLIGGQIRGEVARLFEVYGEGNFIEATADTCFFQMGESKYGKPVLDRVIERDTSLIDATKCTLVSFRPARQSVATRDPAAPRAALPNAGSRLFAERHAGQVFPQLATGSLRQLGRATRFHRTSDGAGHRRRPHGRYDGDQSIRLF